MIENSSFPLSLTINNVTITILNITQNKKFDCKQCYNFIHKESCDYRKDCNIAPSKMLCGTEVEIVVSNMSNSSFGIYSNSCNIIDCNAFSYSNQSYCSDFQSNRFEYSFNDVLPKTKVRGFLLFPELEGSVWVSQLIIRYDRQNSFIFNIGKFNQSVEDEIKSTKETDAPSGDAAVSLRSINNEIMRLKELIFRRCNNVLQNREKVSLDNSIKNSEFHIRLLIDTLPEKYKEETSEELEKIIYDYLSNIRDVATLSQNQTYVEQAYKEGSRPDLGDTIFRSSWEANIARILNRNNISWEYEKECFELNDIPYLPDFFIGDDTILEVKGFWDSESADKVDLFIRTFPNKKVYIVDGDMYQNLETIYTTYAPILHWEKTASAIISYTKVAVVGISFLKDTSVLKALSVGDKLFIEREENNEYDKYAIAVKTIDGKFIGHFEKRFAAIYSEKLKLGMTYDIVIEEIKRKAIIVKVIRNNFESLILYDILRAK